MQKKAIFLDRDGTIIEDRGHVHRIKDLKFLPNAIKGLKLLDKLGYTLIIATNQAGIGKGYYTEEDYLLFRDEIHRRLKDKRVSITAEYFCPHTSEDNCNCRKPKTGMLEQAMRDFDLDLGKCWMIGDSYSDIDAGKTVGCRTIYISNGNFVLSSDFIAKDLEEAAGYITSFYK